MIKLMRSLALFLVVPLTALPALARPKHKSTHKSAHKTAPAKVKGTAKPDIEAKVLVRKKAPFILEEQFRGDNVRLNKDGTFSREGELGSFTSQGHWKVKHGKLMLKWNTGEEYGYRLTFSGKTPLVASRKPSKGGRYTLSSAD